MIEKRLKELEEKVKLLENQYISTSPEKISFGIKRFLFISILLLFTIFISYLALGIPNHYYQVVFALVTIIFMYYRNLLILPSAWYHWLLPILNSILFTFYFKLIIGSGKALPFAWFKLPKFNVQNSEDKLFKFPKFNLNWEDNSLSEFAIDITIIQSFLFLVCLFGGIFSFQPLTSFIALILILFSIPALINFSWDLVIPAILLGALALTLQMSKRRSS